MSAVSGLVAGRSAADYITTSTEDVFLEVEDARRAAHAKHGDQSIEAIDGSDLRWLSILVEEVGEAAHELTYDASGDLRSELVDVATVVVAWIAALDRTGREGYDSEAGEDG